MINKIVISYAENAGAFLVDQRHWCTFFFLCLFVYDLNNLYGLDNLLNGFFACMKLNVYIII